MSGARNSSRAPRTIFVLPSATTRQRTQRRFNTDARASRQGASNKDVLASKRAALGPAPTVNLGNLLGASSSSSSLKYKASAKGHANDVSVGASGGPRSMTESLPPALTTTSQPHALEATNEDRTVNCKEPRPSKAPDQVRGGPILPLRRVCEGLFGRRVPAVVEATTRAAVRQGNGRSTVQAVSPSLRLIMA